MDEITKELLDALKTIESWNSHTTAYAVDFGSNGVRDFYRAIARQSIAKAEATLAAPQPADDEPVTDSYVQTVPDKCDRIVWRGRYIHLSVGQETTPQPSEDGWIPWAGGECPVERRAVVRVKAKNGEIDTDKAHFYDWWHTGGPNDIVAYRVVKS